MIVRGSQRYKENIRELWGVCFPNEDKRYVEYYYRNIYNPEYSLLMLEDSRLTAVLTRIPHEIMIKGRVLKASMISGIATHPAYRKRGYMTRLMAQCIDEVSHSELITLIQTEKPQLYEPFGFEMMYGKYITTITREDVARLTNEGCLMDPSEEDLLKLYAKYTKHFNGYYIRDLSYFIVMKREVSALGGKIFAYYENDEIQGYAVMMPRGKELYVEECLYLDVKSLYKLLNLALQQRLVAHIYTSDAEDLSLLFPNAQVVHVSYTMARLNDAELFNRLYQTEVKNTADLKRVSARPLFINESR